MGESGLGTTLSCIVTTSLKPDCQGQLMALQLAKKLGVSVVNREKLSLKELYDKYGVQGVIVVESERVVYYYPGGEFFFHPDKSNLRIKEIKAGKTDQMIKAMDARPGYSILDCTLGLATDAIVASYVVGATGKVVGLESSPIIAALVESGLKNYYRCGNDVIGAMRRISVMCVEHEEYLSRLRPNSYDIVYFDPMFRKPKCNACCPIDSLRVVANHSPVNAETVKLARQVARHRVVIKERRESKEFDRLGVDMVVGGKYSPVRYGVWLQEGGGH